MPDAYKTGFKRFYGRDFFVNKNVLIPRIETEEIIDIFRKQCHPELVSGSTICDVGCGSGCIGITLALEFKCDVTLIDISDKALDVAKINAERLKVDVKLIKHDLLDKPYDIVVANLPYIPYARINKLDTSVKNFEPLLALDGGKRGLEVIYKLLKNCQAKIIILEIDDTHTKKDFERFGQVKIIKDKFKRNRFVIIRPCTK